MKNFRSRLGIFFMLVGVTILALFFTSDFVQEPNIGFLFWGVVFTLLGFWARRAARRDREESQRFRLLRRIFSRKKKEE